MGHAAPNSLGCCCFRLVPRRPGKPGLFGGGPSAACSAEATGWWLPVLADPAPSGGVGGWCRLTEPSHSCGEASHARRVWASSKSTRAVRGSSGSASCRSETRRIGAHLIVAILALAVGVSTIITVYRIGDSGAQSVWGNELSETGK